MLRLLWPMFMVAALHLSAAGIPVIYCTDLFHPHDDPDDHFDLATLFALPELEVKAILLDQGDKQLKRPGAIPVRQMMHFTGRQAPFAIGLGRKLASPADDGRAQPAEFQAAVHLLLKTLREAAGPVTIISAGSVRDLCAAWNREPTLIQRKVGRLYLNIGNANRRQSEYNVDSRPPGLYRTAALGPAALSLFLSADAAGGPQTPSTAPGGSSVNRRSCPRLRANCRTTSFTPCESARRRSWTRRRRCRRTCGPGAASCWEMDRNMWCTASFLHAAGRTVRKAGGAWTASRRPPSDAPATAPFTFIPARIEADQSGATTWGCPMPPGRTRNSSKFFPLRTMARRCAIASGNYSAHCPARPDQYCRERQKSLRHPGRKGAKCISAFRVLYSY